MHAHCDEIEWLGSHSLRTVTVPKLHLRVLDGEAECESSTRIFTHDVTHALTDLDYILQQRYDLA